MGLTHPILRKIKTKALKCFISGLDSITDPPGLKELPTALIWYHLQICLDISTPSSSKFSRESIYSTEKICVFTYGNSQYRELQAFDLSIGTAIGCKNSEKKVVKGFLSLTFNIKLISTNNSENYVSIKYSD